MRKMRLCIVFFVLLPACTTNQKQMNIPVLASPGDRGYVTGELIFEPDRRPTTRCHASTIAETPAGLIAAWFGGFQEKNPDVEIWVYRQTGEEWTEPVQVAHGIYNDTLFSCWNPVLFQSENGPLLLFYKVGPDHRHGWGQMMTSGDGGLSWSEDGGRTWSKMTATSLPNPNPGTDAIQAIILIAGALVSAAYLLFSMPEGPGPYAILPI